MNGLNQNQERHVISVFARVDELLADVERHARGEQTPFARERADIDPDASRLLIALARSIRSRMLTTLDTLAIERPRQTQSARWTVQTAFRFADIALSEMDAAHLAGYGAVDRAASDALEAMVAEVRSLVEQGSALLQGDAAAALRERLAAVPGVAGEVLRDLERISDAHDLVEIRGLIAAAAERASSDTFEVGVFGRVSTGKTSLINALAGTHVLPVGATPVTAVSLRVCRGEPEARVQLAAGEWQRIALEEIARYATEEENPDNRRGVCAVHVSVPTLAPRLCLIDTPGVGSLSMSGAAQAFASLPRCDMGLVLVAAGASFGQDEHALISALVNAGIPCHVLLSKSDLLSRSDMDRAIRYVKREIDTVLGPPNAVPVIPVSTHASNSSALDDFRRDIVDAALERHRLAADRALERRLQGIITLAADALDGRHAPMGSAKLASHAARTAAAESITRITDRLAGGANDVLQELADDLASARRNRESGESAVRQRILTTVGEALSQVTTAVRSSSAPARPEGEPVRLALRVPPLFDAAFLKNVAIAEGGSIPALLSGVRAVRDLESLRAPLETALQLYASRLRTWGLASLAAAHEEQSGGRPRHRTLSPELARVASALDEGVARGALRG